MFLHQEIRVKKLLLYLIAGIIGESNTVLFCQVSI